MSQRLLTLNVPVAARLSLVSRFPLFRGLGPEALLSLAAESSLREARRRQRLFEQGDPAVCCWVLASGLVKITSSTEHGEVVILRLNGPGELVAGVGLAAGGTHLVSAAAVEPSQVLLWSRPMFEAALECYPALAGNALRIMHERLRELEEEPLPEVLMITPYHPSYIPSQRDGKFQIMNCGRSPETSRGEREIFSDAPCSLT